MVKVSGKKVAQGQEQRADGSQSRSSYLSTFSMSVSIPSGADEQKAKMKKAGQTVQVTFPKKKGHRRPQRGGLRNLNIPGDKI